ncbi:hypothetical protein [Pseudooceanicola sp.]|uniref:hypothetical protein n=1 Tax=Pseudooceanicola sp. TaxID=1914328 RepID=UPI00260F5C32|nr:hypothetical protein [Pseudooceanicola sp.]MDF1856188.1 hypothetical protein [Pseudooceanicola sp.]
MRMELLPSSFLALVVLAALAVTGPYRGLALFLATTCFGAAAAFNLPALGGASILIADIAALMMFALVALRRDGPGLIAGSMRLGEPGFWLLLLALFAILATLFFPRLFEGQTLVFSLTRDLGEEGIIAIPLRPSAGNLTQLFRLMLGVAIFYALATVFRLRPDGPHVLRAIAVLTAVNVGLGWIDVLSHAIGLPHLLDLIRSANYAMLDDVYMAGVKRMVGGYPEASAYGYFSLGIFAFWARYWISAPRLPMAGIMLALSTIAILHSTSSASYVATLAFLLVTAALAMLARLRSQVSRRGLAVSTFAFVLTGLTALLLITSYAFLAPVQNFFDNVLFDKLASDSGVERMSWNAQAFKNFLETRMMGAGLGSVRASSWIMATLASLGVIGTLLFLLFIASVLKPLPRNAGTGTRAITIAALKSACLGLLISSLLTGATPDLGLIFFACAGLAAGLSRGAILQHRDRAQPPL